MVDWTKRRAGVVKGRRYVTHYGVPNCPHPAGYRTSRLIDDMIVVTCRCGMEQRFEMDRKQGFPRQA